VGASQPHTPAHTSRYVNHSWWHHHFSNPAHPGVTYAA
jgi:hypothetical protein